MGEKVSYDDSWAPAESDQLAGHPGSLANIAFCQVDLVLVGGMLSPVGGERVCV